MLKPEEKSFFIHVALGARDLSNCSTRTGAVIVRGRKLLGYGYNRKVTTKDDWEMTSIYDAIFGARSEDLDGTGVFCTYFPTIADIMLMVSVGVSSIHFLGTIKPEENSESIQLLNQLNSEHNPLEIIQLKNN
jgi:deoxycytidylate deaminase